MKRLRVHRIETRWDCEAEFELSGKHSAHIWEELSVQPPASARPYCCYIATVIFYGDGVGHDEIARCEHMDFVRVSPALLFLSGRWWELSGTSIVQRDGRWCACHHLHDNSRAAIEANLGREAARKYQLAALS